MRPLLLLGILALASPARSAEPEFALKVFASRENGLGYAVERDSKFLGYRWAFGFLAKRTTNGLPVAASSAVAVPANPAPVAVQPLSVPATLIIPEQRIPASVPVNPVIPTSRPVETTPPPVRVVPFTPQTPATVPCDKPAETLFATHRR